MCGRNQLEPLAPRFENEVKSEKKSLNILILRIRHKAFVVGALPRGARSALVTMGCKK